MNDHLDFAAFLHERMKERGLSPTRLSELTGVAPEHIEHFLRGEFEKLPSAPYVRGYLEKLGRVLGFDAQEWWEELRREGEVKSSGHKDELPKNRFAPRPIAKYLWSGGILALALGLYLAFRIPAIFGRPELSVINPPTAILRVAEHAITISGEVRGVEEVSINAEHTPAAGGVWEKTIPLQPGLNTIEIVAKKFLGGETKLIRQVIYEPPITVATSTPQAPKESDTNAPVAP